MKKSILFLIAFLVASSSAFAAKALVHIDKIEADPAGGLSVYYTVAVKKNSGLGGVFSSGVIIDTSKTKTQIKTDLQNAIISDTLNIANTTISTSDIISVTEII